MNIEAMAREAGFQCTTHLSGRVSISGQSVARFERFAALVRAHTLEEAARVCSLVGAPDPADPNSALGECYRADVAEECADAIRAIAARPTQTPP